MVAHSGHRKYTPIRAASSLQGVPQKRRGRAALDTVTPPLLQNREAYLSVKEETNYNSCPLIGDGGCAGYEVQALSRPLPAHLQKKTENEASERGGLPHPDGTPRIRNASSRLSTARKNMMTAHNRLDCFLETGSVPEDLKRSG